MNDTHPPTIDPVAALRWQRRPHVIEGRLASAWLHEEVARRMEERLGWIVRQPRSWLHWEPVRGGLAVHEQLARRYPGVPASLHADVPEEASAAWRLARPAWWKRWQAMARSSSGPGAPVDLLWANMSLHMAADPLALMRAWHAGLNVDGLLMFSCFGPDTLRELRQLYTALGWPPPAHEYTDMHDWGDMLVASGFAEPVMDMERIELTFDSPERLLRELRELGRNLHPARFPGLRGKDWRKRLLTELGRLADPAQDGRLRLTFEIIYGHALRPERRLAVTPEMRLSVDELRTQLQRRRD
ncbi:biotin synthase [Hylemonella gracilis]|uniref:Biotin synthase n=1 Tax=Hylemonella gracilis TaxID=80880 RepID=A0A4P6UED1_9BURK|nr:biotin synthase [Hylemonella gracilis]QBK03518.1 biotin synthase [Hylemonella gracilis]